jgi:hypothetical protein
MKKSIILLGAAIAVFGCHPDRIPTGADDSIESITLKAAFAAMNDEGTFLAASNRMSYVHSRIQALEAKLRTERHGEIRESYVQELMPLQLESTNAFIHVMDGQSVFIFQHDCADEERSCFIAFCRPEHEPLQLILVYSGLRNDWQSVRSRVSEVYTSSFSVLPDGSSKFALLLGEIFDSHGNATNARLLEMLCDSEFIKQQ